MVGFGIVGMLAAIPGAVAIAIGVTSGGTVMTVIGVGFGAVWVGTVIVVMAALEAVFQAALYRYAVTGDIDARFERAGLLATFQSRR